MNIYNPVKLKNYSSFLYNAHFFPENKHVYIYYDEYFFLF